MIAPFNRALPAPVAVTYAPLRTKCHEGRSSLLGSIRLEVESDRPNGGGRGSRCCRNDDTTGFQKFKWGLRGAGNIALNVVGNLAAIYNLGFGTVKNAASESTFVKNGAFAF